MTKAEIKQYVYNFFHAKDFPHATICAIMGNIDGENSSWEITMEEASGGGGFGLCQWTDTQYSDRRSQLVAYGTSLKAQCEFLYSELTGKNLSVTGADAQWIANPHDTVDNGEGFTCSLNTFLTAGISLDNLTKAFCYCFERPAYATNHLSVRQSGAQTYYNTMAPSGGGTGNTPWLTVVKDVKKLVADTGCVYNQSGSVNITYNNHTLSVRTDCSGVTSAMLIFAGYLSDTYGSYYYTEGIPELVSNGWTKKKFTSWSQLHKGDVISCVGHVEVFSHNSNGKHYVWSAGSTSTIQNSGVSIDSGSHDYATVYTLGSEDSSDSVDKDDSPDIVDYGDSLYSMVSNYDSSVGNWDNVDVLKSKTKDSTCHIKHSFTKKMNNYGKTVNGQTLKVNGEEYTIKGVRKKDGMVRVRQGDGIYFVNPRFIID